MSFRSVIFDLDGTLIDSSPGILECISRALEQAGMQPAVPLENSLIGPPLRRTLKNLTGLPDGDALEGLAANFRQIYDTEGYRGSRVYPGVEKLLSNLASRGIPMAIATNKRRSPTMNILEYLGWERYFRMVGTLDTPANPHADKASLLRSMLAETEAEARTVHYMGDRWEDGEAASANGMPFIAAGWGYGDWGKVELPADWRLVRSPQEITKFFQGRPQNER